MSTEENCPLLPQNNGYDSLTDRVVISKRKANATKEPHPGELLNSAIYARKIPQPPVLVGFKMECLGEEGDKDSVESWRAKYAENSHTAKVCGGSPYHGSGCFPKTS